MCDFGNELISIIGEELFKDSLNEEELFNFIRGIRDSYEVYPDYNEETFHFIQAHLVACFYEAVERGYSPLPYYND